MTAFLFLKTSDKTRVAREAKKAVCEEFGIPQDVRIVGMVARVAAQKDYETLRESGDSDRRCTSHRRVFSLWVTMRSSRCIAIINSKIKQILVNLNLEPAFVFTGFRKDVGRLIDALDVFVLSTHLEGFHW
jgi:glycosyltransferase involved in cell wall biosynthesis